MRTPNNISFKNRESHKKVHTNRDKGRLIEFRLNDDESSENTKGEESKNISKDLKKKFYKPKLSEPNTGVVKRLYSNKSDPKMDTLKTKYGHSSIGTIYRPKNPSILIDKSLRSSKNTKYDYEKPR